MKRLALAFLVVLGCGEQTDRSASLVRDSASAAGDVSLDSAAVGTVFHGVKYPLTSDNYRRWMVAQAALDSLEEPADMPRIDVRDPTDDDIERTIEFISSRDDERRAIEGSGLSIKDFVLTSVALGQAYDFGHDELVPPSNRSFVDSNLREIEHVRSAQRFHLLDGDDDYGRGRGKGKGKGHGHKHGHGHGHGRK